MKLQEIVEKNLIIDLATFKKDKELVEQVQRKLNALNLYPGGAWIDGIYGPRTEGALVQFCNSAQLENMKTGKFNRAFAEALLKSQSEVFGLEAGKYRAQVFLDFLKAEAGFNADKLAFLDKGIENSPYKTETELSPLRLKEKPDGQKVVSFGEKATPYNSKQSVIFTPYPKIGELPKIDDKGLIFLHTDIKEACICIGSFVEGEIRAHWLGRNALSNVQMWSTTKIIPILNTICKVNRQYPNCDIDNTVIKDKSTGYSYRFNDLVTDVFTYKQKIATSNSLAAMFKRFETYAGLETWLRNITGNKSLQFRGTYGEAAFISSPEIFDQKLQRVVLSAAPETARGNNLVSAYDLTRIISMLGWHYHLPQAARLPGAQWNSLESVIRAMTKDSARYIDVAIKKLALQNTVESPVILSKLGFGRSSTRNRTELAYVAFLQFIDTRPKAQGKPAKLRTLAMALRGAKALEDINQEAIQIDARMAAEVTEIIRRVVTEELI